jgi:hypothetical protein
LFAASLVVLSPRWDLSIIGALVGILILGQNYMSAKNNPPFGAGPSPLAAGRDSR